MLPDVKLTQCPDRHLVDPNTRACIAYVVAALVSGRKGNGIYDYAQSRRISISGSVSSSKVRVYDYDRGCYFTGSPGRLYDYRRNAHLSLSINGNKFSGYDYADNCHFSGAVNGSSISIFDYGEARLSGYSV
jgi:hypothetical protein